MEALHLTPLLLLVSVFVSIFPSVEPQWFWINLHVAGPSNGISVVPATSHPNFTRNTILKTTNHPCSMQTGCINRTSCIAHACPLSERLHECAWPANQDGCEGIPCACSNVMVQQRVGTTQPPASNTTTSYTPTSVSPTTQPCNIQFGCVKPGICARNSGHCPVDHQLDQCHWPVDQPSCVTAPCACPNSLIGPNHLKINASILNHTTPPLSRFS